MPAAFLKNAHGRSFFIPALMKGGFCVIVSLTNQTIYRKENKMPNKNCTPSLIKKKRKHISLLRALFKKESDNGFYTADSIDGKTSLWWIEANQLGQTSCYPCVLYKDGEEHAFVSGRSKKEQESNRLLMEKWKATVNPQTIDILFTVTELDAEEFFRQFNPAEERQLKKLFMNENEEQNNGENVQNNDEKDGE